MSRRAAAACLAAACLAAAAPAAAGVEIHPAARFTDPERLRELQSAFPEIDRLFGRYAADNKIPGMVWGVVIDGGLVHVGTAGVRDLASGAPVTPDTAFRIASMTKSYTALAILKLRDAGRLSLDDRVSKWLPEFARLPLPTRDAAPISIRQLLSHSAGLPEDNPWGDQQLAASDADLTRWLRAGIPFSTAPGTRYEYSNYAYALLGRIVAKAAGMPYEDYLRKAILDPLRLDATGFEAPPAAAGGVAVGYRLRPDGSFAVEPALPRGAFDAMGGLYTTAADLGRYVAFHLSAWPPRDDADPGPLKRASLREMSWRWTAANLTARSLPDGIEAAEAGYGFGLRVTTDCRFEHIVAHGGGLPGFGSYMAWLPDYGVGLFALTNLTYAGPAQTVSKAWDELLAGGGLKPRELPASPALAGLQEPIVSLWNSWDDALARRIGAVNLLLDSPGDERRAAIAALKDEVGACPAVGALRAENWLRAQFNLTCAKGVVGVFFTLAPTQPPAVQHLSFRRIDSDAVRLGAPTGAPAGVSCRGP